MKSVPLNVCWLVFGIAFCSPAGELPQTRAELNSWYVSPPAKQNGARFIVEGISRLETTNSVCTLDYLPWLGPNKPPLPDYPVGTGIRSAVSDILNRNEEALRYFQQGAKFREFRYPVDFSVSGTQPEISAYPYLRGIVNATRIWSLRSLLLAVDGNGDEAGRTVLMNLRLAKSLEALPTLESQLGRCRCTGWITESFEQVVNRSALSSAVLNDLQAELGTMADHEEKGIGFTRGIVGWRILGGLSSGTDAETRFYWDLTGDLLTAWKDPYPKRLKEVKELGADGAKRAKELHWENGVRLAESISQFVEVEARSVSWLRIAQTATALERYRLDHNNYPKQLADLKPTYLEQVPVDPLSGDLLQYGRKGRGYFLYGVGLNLRDDGGSPGEGQGSDLVFHVVAPPPLGRR